VIEKLRSKIPVWLSDCGATVAVNEDPFVVAVVTPIISRTHCTAFIRDVDSTASCGADNHVITFLLTPTPAGAVPLGLVITDSVSQLAYTRGGQQSHTQDTTFKLSRKGLYVHPVGKAA